MSRLSLALCVLLAAPSAAQAPRITPAGDPSVKSDTIYRLAVNPADYQDQTFVYLLDDGVLRFEADGRSSRTYRQVVQILSQDAVEGCAERSFSYTVGHERLTVNWVRVLTADGGTGGERPPRVHLVREPSAQDRARAVRRVSQHCQRAHPCRRSPLVGGHFPLVRRRLTGPLRALDRGGTGDRHGGVGRHDAGRFAAGAASLGGAGLPVRVDRAGHRRVRAAAAGPGPRDPLRGLQGQGDALYRGGPALRGAGEPGSVVVLGRR